MQAHWVITLLFLLLDSKVVMYGRCEPENMVISLETLETAILV
jgi:hypothetical protein